MRRSCTCWIACVTLLVIMSCSASEESAAARLGRILERSSGEGEALLRDAERLGYTGESALRTAEENRTLFDAALTRIQELGEEVNAEAIVEDAMCSVFIDAIGTEQLPTLDDLKGALLDAGIARNDFGAAFGWINEFDDLVGSSADVQEQQLRILMLKYHYCP